MRRKESFDLVYRVSNIFNKYERVKKRVLSEQKLLDLAEKQERKRKESFDLVLGLFRLIKKEKAIANDPPLKKIHLIQTTKDARYIAYNIAMIGSKIRERSFCLEMMHQIKDIEVGENNFNLYKNGKIKGKNGHIYDALTLFKNKYNKSAIGRKRLDALNKNINWVLLQYGFGDNFTRLFNYVQKKLNKTGKQRAGGNIHIITHSLRASGIICDNAEQLSMDKHPFSMNYLRNLTLSHDLIEDTRSYRIEQLGDLESKIAKRKAKFYDDFIEVKSLEKSGLDNLVKNLEGKRESIKAAKDDIDNFSKEYETLKEKIDNPPEYEEIKKYLSGTKESKHAKKIEKIKQNKKYSKRIIKEADLFQYHLSLISEKIDERYDKYIDRLVSGCFENSESKNMPKKGLNKYIGGFAVNYFKKRFDIKRSIDELVDLNLRKHYSEEWDSFSDIKKENLLIKETALAYSTPIIAKIADSLENTQTVSLLGDDKKIKRFEHNYELINGLNNFEKKLADHLFHEYETSKRYLPEIFVKLKEKLIDTSLRQIGVLFNEADNPKTPFDSYSIYENLFNLKEKFIEFKKALKEKKGDTNPFIKAFAGKDAKSGDDYSASIIKEIGSPEKEPELIKDFNKETDNFFEKLEKEQLTNDLTSHYHIGAILKILDDNDATLFQKILGVSQDIIDIRKNYRMENLKEINLNINRSKSRFYNKFIHDQSIKGRRLNNLVKNLSENDEVKGLMWEIKEYLNDKETIIKKMKNPPQYNWLMKNFKGQNIQDSDSKTYLFLHNVSLLTRKTRENHSNYIDRIVKGCFENDFIEPVIKDLKKQTEKEDSYLKDAADIYASPIIAKLAEYSEKTDIVGHSKSNIKLERFDNNFELLEGIENFENNFIKYFSEIYGVEKEKAEDLIPETLHGLRKELIKRTIGQVAALNEKIYIDSRIVKNISDVKKLIKIQKKFNQMEIMYIN